MEYALKKLQEYDQRCRALHKALMRHMDNPELRLPVEVHLALADCNIFEATAMLALTEGEQTLAELVAVNMQHPFNVALAGVARRIEERNP